MTSFIESIFGPHAEFIVASYAAVILLIGGLSLAIIADHRRQARLIAERDPRAREPESMSQS